MSLIGLIVLLVFCNFVVVVITFAFLGWLVGEDRQATARLRSSRFVEVGKRPPAEKDRRTGEP